MKTMVGLLRPMAFVGAQGLSTLGSAATAFAVDVWVFQHTGSYALFASLALLGALPTILLSPFSGALVDRFPRGKLLLCCDLASFLVIASATTLAALERFSVFGAGALIFALAVIQTVRWPALLSTVSMLTAKEHIPRITGFEEAVQATSTIAAPIIGAAMFHFSGLLPIFLLDMLSFTMSILAVILARLPLREDANTQALAQQRGGVFSDPAFGFRWIVERRHLLRLLMFLALFNIGCAIFVTTQTPLVLSYLDTAALATVMATGSAGLVLGGILMTAIGGIRPYQRGVLLGACGIATGITIFGFAHSTPLFALGAFLFGFLHPVVNSSTQVIWREETPLDIQGRVFATRRMISWGLNPLAIALSIPLTAYIFGPLLEWSSQHLPRLAALWGAGQAGRIAMMLCTLGIAMLGLTAYCAVGRKLDKAIVEGKLVLGNEM